MGHAREWCAARWPAAPPPEEARPDLRWIPDGKGGFRPMTAAHDFWGVFDLLVADPHEGVLGIQVTTAQPNESNARGATSHAAERRRKIETWLRDEYGDLPCPITCYVIAWVARRHFRIWRWWPAEWAVDGATLEQRRVDGRWEELRPEKASGRPSPAPLLEAAEPLPF